MPTRDNADDEINTLKKETNLILDSMTPSSAFATLISMKQGEKTQKKWLNTYMIASTKEIDALNITLFNSCINFTNVHLCNYCTKIFVIVVNTCVCRRSVDNKALILSYPILMPQTTTEPRTYYPTSIRSYFTERHGLVLVTCAFVKVPDNERGNVAISW